MESIETMTKLLEPFPKWTAEGQIKWMLKKVYSAKVIDYAMTELYKRLAEGESFESGDALDKELLKIASDSENADIKEYIDAANTLKQKVSSGKMKKLWMVIKGEL